MVIVKSVHKSMTLNIEGSQNECEAVDIHQDASPR